MNDIQELSSGEKYHEIVSDICHRINEYIVAEVMKCGEVKPISIGDTYIALKVNRDAIENIRKVVSETSVRVFGRSFNIGAEIEVY